MFLFKENDSAMIIDEYAAIAKRVKELQQEELQSQQPIPDIIPDVMNSEDYYCCA
jgi:hypothetical protein